MSALFADLGGFRMPDVRMNDGPLPSGNGINATPDGVINGTNSLLSNITPYAYGESDRTGSDRNYQQIPHRVQYIVLPLFLPSQDSATLLKVSHVVDQGDLAFVLNTQGRQWFGAGENPASTGPGTLPQFANLACVNYMLGCLQVSGVAGGAGVGGATRRSWPAIRAHLWKRFDPAWADEEERELTLFEYAKYTVEHLFKPHGVCAGSEKQGGQHEETWAPVQAAVNYTTTMTVDGQNRDLVNYWQAHHMCAGDRLVLRLELHNRNARATAQGERTAEFQLTSYYKRPVSAAITTADSYWQLVPHILNAETEADENMARDARESGTKEEVRLARFEYRLNGYWQIAQSFQGRRSFDVGRTGRSGIHGAPLQVTFSPVFVRGADEGGASDVAWDWEELLATFMTKRTEEFPADRVVWMAGARDERSTSAFLFKFGVAAGTIRRIFEGDRETAEFISTSTYNGHSLLLFFWLCYYATNLIGVSWARRVVQTLRSAEMRRIVAEQNDAAKRAPNTQLLLQLMFGISEAGIPHFVGLLERTGQQQQTIRHIMNQFGMHHHAHARARVHVPLRPPGGPMRMRLGEGALLQSRLASSAAVAVAAVNAEVAREAAPENGASAAFRVSSEVPEATEGAKKKGGRKRGAGMLSTGAAEIGAAEASAVASESVS